MKRRYTIDIDVALEGKVNPPSNTTAVIANVLTAMLDLPAHRLENLSISRVEVDE